MMTKELTIQCVGVVSMAQMSTTRISSNDGKTNKPPNLKKSHRKTSTRSTKPLTLRSPKHRAAARKTTTICEVGALKSSRVSKERWLASAAEELLNRNEMGTRTAMSLTHVPTILNWEKGSRLTLLIITAKVLRKIPSWLMEERQWINQWHRSKTSCMENHLRSNCYKRKRKLQASRITTWWDTPTKTDRWMMSQARSADSAIVSNLFISTNRKTSSNVCPSDL